MLFTCWATVFNVGPTCKQHSAEPDVQSENSPSGGDSLLFFISGPGIINKRILMSLISYLGQLYITCWTDTGQTLAHHYQHHPPLVFAWLVLSWTNAADGGPALCQHCWLAFDSNHVNIQWWKTPLECRLKWDNLHLKRSNTHIIYRHTANHD